MLRDFAPSDPLSQPFLDEVSRELREFLDSQVPLMEAVGTSELMRHARTYTDGGKRLRPGFCVWGYRAAGGDLEQSDAVMKAAASLELLQASLLVHDDLIDDADTRRGHPSAHRLYEQLHAQRGGRGSQHFFGASASVLLGDMLLMWSDELFEQSKHPNLGLARQDLSALRMEVIAGQFLDISAAFGVADNPNALEVARTVLQYKSASYSMRRPVLIGARLAGCSRDTYDALGTFGNHIGQAFQLRDDVLGIWGDEDLTGKPQGDDLREGKATVLVLTALERASAEDRAILESVLGNKDADDDAIAAAARIIRDTGARDVVERLIEDHLAESLVALNKAELTDDGRSGLKRLAELSVRRAF